MTKKSWATIIFCNFINSVHRLWRDILLKKFLPCWGKRKIVIIGLLGTKGFFELSLGYLHQQGVPLMMCKGTIVWLEMKDTDKWQCYDHFRPFFALFMFIFHKTGSDGHFRCLTVLNYDWFESYNTNIFIFAFFVILYKIKRFRFCIYGFFVIRLVNHLKMTIWIPVLWKKTWSWQKNGQLLYLGVCRTCKRPQATSEAITFEPIKI